MRLDYRDEEWVTELQGEVARLRERAAELEEACLAQLRAHEATKARYQTARAQANEASRRVSAAEQRVAELERENAALRMTNRVEEADADEQRDRRRAAVAALSSARELLEQVPAPLASVSVEWIRRRDAWLRAHPEPTTTEQRELRLQAQGFEPVTEEQQAKNLLVNLGQATPAATGAEPRCAYEGCKQIDEGEGKCFHGE